MRITKETLLADREVGDKLIDILPHLPDGIHQIQIGDLKLRVARLTRVGDKLILTKNKEEKKK